MRPVLMRDLTAVWGFPAVPALPERGDGGLYVDAEKEPFVRSLPRLTPFILISFCNYWYFCLI